MYMCLSISQDKQVVNNYELDDCVCETFIGNKSYQDTTVYFSLQFVISFVFMVLMACKVQDIYRNQHTVNKGLMQVCLQLMNTS